MKKILASILSVIITASAYAEWKVQFDAGLFYYEDGTPIEE